MISAFTKNVKKRNKEWQDSEGYILGVHGVLKPMGLEPPDSESLDKLISIYPFYLKKKSVTYGRGMRVNMTRTQIKYNVSNLEPANLEFVLM